MTTCPTSTDRRRRASRRSFPFEELPIELQHYVLQSMSVNIAWGCRRTCVLFRDAFMQTVTKQNELSVTSPMDHDNMESIASATTHMHSALAQMPHITHLHVSAGLTRVHIPETCTQLTWLSSSFSSLAHVVLVQSLRRIQLMYTLVTDLSPLAVCRQLTHLTVCQPTLRDISPVRACSATLRYLSLIDCSSLAGDSVDLLAGFRSLTYLNLSNTDRTNIDGLATCTSLVGLFLGDNKNLGDISSLQNCPKLQALDLHDCVSLNDISSLSACTDLRILALTNCEAVHDIGALQKCTTSALCRCKLEHLMIRGCTLLKAAEVAASLCPTTTLTADGDPSEHVWEQGDFEYDDLRYVDL